MIINILRKYRCHLSYFSKLAEISYIITLFSCIMIRNNISLAIFLFSLVLYLTCHKMYISSINSNISIFGLGSKNNNACNHRPVDRLDRGHERTRRKRRGVDERATICTNNFSLLCLKGILLDAPRQKSNAKVLQGTRGFSIRLVVSG
jgi:hypothetical protein